MKKTITLLLTDEQYNKIQRKKQETGNSQNSIVRTALNKYLQEIE
jgi:predicted DNA-binding protein